MTLTSIPTARPPATRSVIQAGTPLVTMAARPAGAGAVGIVPRIDAPRINAPRINDLWSGRRKSAAPQIRAAGMALTAVTRASLPTPTLIVIRVRHVARATRGETVTRAWLVIPGWIVDPAVTPAAAVIRGWIVDGSATRGGAVIRGWIVGLVTRAGMATHG